MGRCRKSWELLWSRAGEVSGLVLDFFPPKTYSGPGRGNRIELLYRFSSLISSSGAGWLKGCFSSILNRKTTTGEKKPHPPNKTKPPIFVFFFNF